MQEMFLRHVLRSRHFDSHKIRFRPSPAGRGAAEQFVREEYPGEVRKVRSRAQQNVGLIAMIDADRASLRTRFRQFNQKLLDADQARRGSRERIAVMIARRNLETWIAYLVPLADGVSEAAACATGADPYKRLVNNKNVPPAACAYVGQLQGARATPAVPSLKASFSELRRV